VITDSEDRSMIAELEQIIQAEEAKPVAERDVDLIDDCIREIAELKGVKADFSDEEVAKITDKLIKKTDREKRKKRLARIAAGIAAVFVLVGGVTACTINPVLIDWLAKIVRMPFGSNVYSGTITYMNQGNTQEYDNVTQLIEAEKLEIYYPSILPDNVSLIWIDTFQFNGSFCLAFHFSDSSLHFTAEMNCIEDHRAEEVVSEIDNGTLHFDVFGEVNSYIAICEYDQTRYILECQKMEDIILVIGGLRKG